MSAVANDVARESKEEALEKRYFRVRELCDMTGLSKGKIFDALHDGSLVGLKLEGVLLIPADSVDAYLATAVPWEPATSKRNSVSASTENSRRRTACNRNRTGRKRAST